jgi:tetratricopeptide (TPR) repeat protein
VPQYYLGVAADVLLAAGRAGDALAHLDRAVAGVDEPGVGFYLPEIYRLRGECLLALDRSNKDEAKRTFVTASEIARRQGAIVLKHRADASLGKLN